MLSLLAALVLGLPGRPAEPRDACASALPKTLAAAFARSHPAFRLPTERDNAREDSDESRRRGGSGCLGVASGDFDGDRDDDRAFLATSRTEVWLFVAFRRSRGWRIEKVWESGSAGYRARLYVDAAPPGRYSDLGLGDTPEPGQVESFDSPTDVVITGATESTAVAFRKGPKGWVHVWLSD
jgi:hypothetical protein